MVRPLLPVLALSLLLAACGATTTGVPAPVTSAPIVTTAPSSTSTPLVPLPPRPRDIDTTGIDTCTLLTEQQIPEFGFDVDPVRNDYNAPFYRNGPVRSCTFTSVERSQNVAFLISDRDGIEEWTTHPIKGTVRPESVNGFPAITAIAEDLKDFCTVVVDIGPNTVLDVDFGDGGRKPAIPLATLCQRAHQTAELAMNTLTTTMGR